MEGQLARVLLVEDNDAIRRCLANLLADHFEVTAVASGKQAIERLQNASFDAVLTDLLMPGVSGLELHRWIVANRPNLARRVVLMGGSQTDAASAALIKRGGIRSIQKPFTFAAILLALEELLLAPAA